MGKRVMWQDMSSNVSGICVLWNAKLICRRPKPTGERQEITCSTRMEMSADPILIISFRAPTLLEMQYLVQMARGIAAQGRYRFKRWTQVVYLEDANRTNAKNWHI